MVSHAHICNQAWLGPVQQQFDFLLFIKEINTTMNVWPKLFAVGKNNQIKVWSARVEGDEKCATAIIEFGQDNGKLQKTERVYSHGKNIGKKNETTPLAQALFETNRKFIDKQEKDGYSTEISVRTKIAPMLAHTFDRTNNKSITFPCFAQPKIDGLRCLIYLNAEGSVCAQSRSGTLFRTIRTLTQSLILLFKTFPDLILDGELFSTLLPFETLTGQLNKQSGDVTDVFFYIFDIISDEPFEQRTQKVHELSSDLRWNKFMVFVSTIEIDEFQFDSVFNQFIDNGYEGIILRNKHGLYAQGFRSHDLQKYKPFLEDEFLIVGFDCGKGREQDCVIWICSSHDSKNTFSVRPKGSIQQRREWFNNGRTFIGKQLTVTFQEYSLYNIPRFPVGKMIRNDIAGQV